jgi:hypothetical protein
MLDNEFSSENNVLLHPPVVAVFKLQHQPEQATMRTTKPFTVFQNGKPLFTVYAYSAEQARALVAAKVAGAVIVVAVKFQKPPLPVAAARDGAAR